LPTSIIFGASGATGGFLLPRLVARGDDVVALSRQAQPAQACVRWLCGDLFGAMPALPADAERIVSLGPLEAFSHWFARQAPSAVRRVLALSSMSAQSKRDSSDAAERELAARLRAAEARVAEAAAARGIAWTILRPTLIYGDGHDRSLAPIVRFARRWRVLPVPIGAHGLRQPVHAADHAYAVAAALECAAAAGQVYPIGGGERLGFSALVRRLRGAVPGAAICLPLPRAVIAAGLRWQGFGAAGNAAAMRRLDTALVADNSAAARDFGYAPRTFMAADVLPTGLPPGAR
jgi:nucleoside-diphosphate-sugar epimerase